MSVDLDKWREMEAICEEGGAWSVDENDSGEAAIQDQSECPLVLGELEAACYFRNHAKEMADEVERLRAEAKASDAILDAAVTMMGPEKSERLAEMLDRVADFKERYGL